MLSHSALKVVADSVNPSLGILALSLPFVKWHRVRKQAWMHMGVTTFTVLLTYFLRAAFGLESVWAGWGLDFSTHTAICSVLVIGLASLDWAKSWIWAGILLGYAALMVYQAYHTWADIGTTAAFVLPYSALIRYWGDRWCARRVPSSTTSVA